MKIEMNTITIQKSVRPLKYVVFEEAEQLYFRAEAVSEHSHVFRNFLAESGLNECDIRPLGGGSLQVRDDKVYVWGDSTSYGTVPEDILENIAAEIKNELGCDEVLFEDPDSLSKSLFSMYT